MKRSSIFTPRGLDDILFYRPAEQHLKPWNQQLKYQALVLFTGSKAVLNNLLSSNVIKSKQSTSHRRQRAPMKTTWATMIQDDPRR